MNKNEKPDQRRKYRSQLSRKLLLQYILAFIATVIIMLAGTFAAWWILGSITWYDNNPVYHLLHFIRDYLPVFLGGAALIVWAALSYIFISKPLRYLDELVIAAEELASPGEEPIILSSDLVGIQNEMNSVRERVLRDAMIAKEAEQRKNDLIVYLAHDLKTPLTSVIGYLTLLRDESDISPELRAKYTGIALDKAVRLEDLINEFFDITRFNLTHLTLESESVNLTRMLEQITFEFNPILAEKELSWETHFDDNVYIICDSHKLQRVFDNLIRNAVNYSYPKTSITISLTKSNETVTVLVKNKGKTIPPEKLNRIFEQFFRLDSSRASTTGGSGLGLAIAKEIVELHEGTITAYSADESVIFTVKLPFSRSQT